MIECICVNSKDKPKEINLSEWIQEGFKYHITHVFIQRNQGNIQGVHLKEVKLTVKSKPYETYKMSRFGILEVNMPVLIEMIKTCSELDNIDISKLIEESQLEIIEQ
jgi:hypothetical protein